MADWLGIARSPAASIWVSATLGAAAALAIWPLIAIGATIALIVRFVGGPIERRIRDRARATPGEQDRIDMAQRP